MQHKADNVLEMAQEFVNNSNVPIDVVFFDLPGTVNTTGILKALAGMHHIFTPITADRVVMESTPLYDVYNQLIEQLGLSLMQSKIKSSTRFRKESEVDSKAVFRSTLMPPDERLMKACQLDEFMNEFLKIIQL